jgi:hypothetical protein
VKKNVMLVTILVSIFTSGRLFAGLLLEPYVGYKFATSADLEKFSISGTSFDSSAEGGNGAEFGGRVGWQFPLIFTAFDYGISSFDIEDTFTFSGQRISQAKSSVDETKMGLVVGAKIPFLRVWLKYLFNVNWEQKDNYLTGLDRTTEYKKETSGSGLAAGVGFTFLPFVNLYLEYSMITLDKVDSLTANGVDVKSQLQLSEERKVNTILFGVSIPLNL